MIQFNGVAMDEAGNSGGRGGDGYPSRASLEAVLDENIFQLFRVIDNVQNQNAFNNNVTDRKIMNRLRGCLVDSGYYQQGNNGTDGNFTITNDDYVYGGKVPAAWCGKWARLYGEDATGIGSGGGGAGVAIAIPDEEEVLKKYLEAGNLGLDKLRNLMFKGTPGKGTSGGIIVTW